MDIRRIKETVEPGQVTEAPRIPAFIRGMINLRGTVQGRPGNRCCFVR
ncbi:hypothetical protein F6R98_18800 [Candidatus Methylospira mobilis]|uniref:CheW-like domain-containing protein n=1 Tax=Candidatus Methylospira mobilis TaxID=1808979 RepID=A0A5Q0BU52_9GAMM|nr:hypothetical protein F6R98_18800 [Candidatus Methylospira mobilis]